MFHIHSLIYSLDDTITPTNLKRWEIDLSKYNTKDLETRMKKKQIESMVSGVDLHFSFSKLSSRPYIIYTRWNKELLDLPLLWVVWPRKVTSYMKTVLGDFFDTIWAWVWATISWWAEWIDTLCHELSIKKWIPTIVVLWWGLWYYLSSSKRDFLQKVIDNGWLIISEFRLKQKPAPWTFPQRNRIVAWLSRCVFTPWAWKKSGTLITIDFAKQMNIPAYTVPASIYETWSTWSNAYLTEGILLPVTNFNSLYDEYFPITHPQTESHTPSLIPLTPVQKTMLNSFKDTTIHSLESFSKVLNVSAWVILSQIAELELLWIIWESSPGRWKKK